MQLKHFHMLRRKLEIVHFQRQNFFRFPVEACYRTSLDTPAPCSPSFINLFSLNTPVLWASSLNLFLIAQVEAWLHSLVARDQYLIPNPNETLLYDWLIRDFHAYARTLLPSPPLPHQSKVKWSAPYSVSFSTDKHNNPFIERNL